MVSIYCRPRPSALSHPGSAPTASPCHESLDLRLSLAPALLAYHPPTYLALARTAERHHAKSRLPLGRVVVHRWCVHRLSTSLDIFLRSRRSRLSPAQPTASSTAALRVYCTSHFTLPWEADQTPRQIAFVANSSCVFFGLSMPFTRTL